MNRNQQFTSRNIDEEIVISGIAGRFPNSDNVQHFQENLFNEIDLATNDSRRWNKGKIAICVYVKILRDRVIAA